MDSLTIFKTALEYEKKIRDLYRSGVDIIDDERGKHIFKALAEEEQSHVDFLQHGIETLEARGSVTAAKLATIIPDSKSINTDIAAMKMTIPQRMLGDVKRVLDSALKLEIETTQYYRNARDASEGDIRKIMDRFVIIEQRHTDVVRFELDHASQNGFWFDFPEISMEVG